MKKFFEITLLFFLSVSLCSCPYSSAYNLDDNPNIYVEDALLGNWVTFIKKPNSSRDEAVYLNLAKKTDTEYHITLTGNMNELRRFMRLTSDSLTGTAFMSTVGDNRFLNVKINSRIYIAQFIQKEDKISILPLAENFTSKMVFSSDVLRKCVEVHYKTRVHPLLDQNFCLRDMVKTN